MPHGTTSTICKTWVDSSKVKEVKVAIPTTVWVGKAMVEKVAKRTTRMITSTTHRKLWWIWWTTSLWNLLRRISNNFQHKGRRLHRIKEEVQTRRNQDSRTTHHHLEATMHIRPSTNHKTNHHIKEDIRRNNGQISPPTWKARIRTFKTSQEIKESIRKWGNQILIRKVIREMLIQIKETEEDMCKMIMTAWDHQEMSTYNPKESVAAGKIATVIMFRKTTNIQVQQRINPSNIKPNQVCENRKRQDEK